MCLIKKKQLLTNRLIPDLTFHHLGSVSTHISPNKLRFFGFFVQKNEHGQSLLFAWLLEKLDNYSILGIDAAHCSNFGNY